METFKVDLGLVNNSDRIVQFQTVRFTTGTGITAISDIQVAVYGELAVGEESGDLVVGVWAGQGDVPEFTNIATMFGNQGVVMASISNPTQSGAVAPVGGVNLMTRLLTVKDFWIRSAIIPGSCQLFMGWHQGSEGFGLPVENGSLIYAGFLITGKDAPATATNQTALIDRLYTIPSYPNGN